MKIIRSLLLLLIIGCTLQEEPKVPKEILSKVQFEDLLKEVHLAEAVFDLEKRKGIEIAKEKLALEYHNIFERHHTDSLLFEKTLHYYSTSNELEQIYSTIIKELTQEKDSLFKH